MVTGSLTMVRTFGIRPRHRDWMIRTNHPLVALAWLLWHGCANELLGSGLLVISTVRFVFIVVKRNRGTGFVVDFERMLEKTCVKVTGKADAKRVHSSAPPSLTQLTKPASSYRPQPMRFPVCSCANPCVLVTSKPDKSSCRFSFPFERKPERVRLVRSVNRSCRRGVG